MWGSCFWFCIPSRLRPAAASTSAALSHTTIFHTQLCHTPSFTHNFIPHHLTPSFTYSFVTHTTLSHSLSRTTLSNTIFQTSQTIFHTQLCHTRSFTHHLSHTIFFKHHLLHTIFHTHLSHTTLSHALAHSNLRFAWQAWHLWHWAGSGDALCSSLQRETGKADVVRISCWSAYICLRQPITFMCWCLRMSRDWFCVQSCFMIQFIFVCLWWKTAKSLPGISRLSVTSAMLFSMLAYKFISASFLCCRGCTHCWSNVERHAWLHLVHESSCHVSILTHRGKKSGMLCKDLRCLKLYRHVWIFMMWKALKSDDVFAVLS